MPSIRWREIYPIWEIDGGFMARNQKLQSKYFYQSMCLNDVKVSDRKYELLYKKTVELFIPDHQQKDGQIKSET